MRGRSLLIRSGMDLGLGRRRSAAALEALFDSIAEALRSGRDVSVVGFGAWTWQDRSARKAHDPRTLRPLQLPERRRLVFKPAAALRRRVQDGGKHEEGKGA